MTRRRTIIWAIAGMFLILLAYFGFQIAAVLRNSNFAGARGEPGVAEISLPPGFEIRVFARDLQAPRFISFGPDGLLYVAERGRDRIVALQDADGDGWAETSRVFAADLANPHSLVFHQDAWYVGVPSGVIRLEDADLDGVAEQRTTLIDDYPTSGHSTRTVEFLPDGRMVVSVGSSCNVCEEGDPRRAAVVVYDGPAATGEQIFASGLRNAVGLAVHPQSGQLWASNNGRDLLGDDLPPENIFIVQPGKDYGWPRCHSGDIEDPDLGFPGSCQDAEPPLVEMQAHSAPLGIVFYTGDSFPESYQGDLFIAFHGSWNRTIPTGYKVVRLPLDGSTPLGPVEDFATGWLDEGTQEVSGRPVGLAVGPQGGLYVSDDKGGIIYRITYSGPN